MDVRGKTYTAVQSSRTTPRTFAKLNGHPKCSNASTTGAGFKNLMIPSGTRKSTTNPLKTRPIQTFLLDEEKRLDRACLERIGCAFPGSGRDHQILKASTGSRRVRAFGMAVELGECPWGSSAALHSRICFSAHVHLRGDLAHGISRRRGGDPHASWGSIVQSRFVSYVFGCAALAGVVLAG